MESRRRVSQDGTNKSILSNDQRLNEYLVSEGLKAAEDDAGKKNLIVNYLPVSFRECHLAHLFNEVGELVSVRIIVDKKTKRSKGYGFVKFTTAEAATSAIEKLNGKKLLGKRLKVAYARPGGPRARANLFVGNVPKYWSDKELNELFDQYGPIIESRILLNGSESRRCGFVRLDTEAAANRAIAEMDGYVPKGQYHGIHVKIAEKPDGRRDAYMNQDMPSTYPHLQPAYDSYMNPESFNRSLKGSVSENVDYNNKRDPTRAKNKRLKQLRQVGKTTSLPLFDEDLERDTFDRFNRDRMLDRKESEPESVNSPTPEIPFSSAQEYDTYAHQSSNGSHGSPYAGTIDQPFNPNMASYPPQQPYVNTFQQPQMVMTLPHVQTYTLQPISGYDGSISPATTPPPYFMATTPPYPMISPTDQMFTPDMMATQLNSPSVVQPSIVSPDPSLPSSPQDSQIDPPRSEKLNVKKKSIKFKKTQSELELEELGIDTADLPPTLPTIEEQGSNFQLSVTNHVSESEAQGEPPAKLPANQFFEEAELPPVVDSNDSEVKVAAVPVTQETVTSQNSVSSAPALPIIQPVTIVGNIPGTLVMENLVQGDLNLQAHLSSNEQTFLSVSPPGAVPVITTSTPPPMRLSPSPMIIPINPNLPVIPLSHSPISMPVLPSPVLAQQNSQPMNASPTYPMYNQMNGQMGPGPVNVNMPYQNQNLYDRSSMTSAPEYLNEVNKPASLPTGMEQDEDKAGNHVCLFVYNLPPFFDEGHVYNLFEKFGPVKYTCVHRHKDGTSKGFGFVNYYTSESARRAIKSLNGNVFYNKKLQVRYKVDKHSQ